jgi:hypothetical protein
VTCPKASCFRKAAVEVPQCWGRYISRAKATTNPGQKAKTKYRDPLDCVAHKAP